MANRLFQQARNQVELAKQSRNLNDYDKAKNALSSAYANSTAAEQLQLRQMQQELDEL
ncbi:DUF3813 domain-containing protein [Falsibacillus albus]|uniref:DUF3813 domain-containing protein n=1 Tax=Falsibacillus albus TaxID=2478915 RepID=A0A3L7K4M6_9BACI|nr:DUF3813 domain-containing protein [Falsibacillus albus]RLQ97214.1 DUF3813 domain-containing protein [Falsibacillus albus]